MGNALDRAAALKASASLVAIIGYFWLLHELPSSVFIFIGQVAVVAATMCFLIAVWLSLYGLFKERSHER